MEFREMRRSKQYLSDEEVNEILAKATSGVLAVNGDGGYPYAVPINFAYDDGKIYFHGAMEGQKADAIKRDDRVSFCVVARDDVQTDIFTSYFKSVIAFGRARVITDPDERQHAHDVFALKFNQDMDAVRAYEEKNMPRIYVYEITIEHMTGKQAKDLAAGIAK